MISTAVTGKEALKLVETADAGVVILDLNDVTLNSIEVCRRIRERNDVSIAIMTSRLDDEHRLAAFSAGATDYISRPFANSEFLLRVKRIATNRRRLCGDHTSNPLRIDHFTIDPSRFEVIANGNVLTITPMQFRLLRFFAENPGRVYSRFDLMRQVWEKDCGTDGTIDQSRATTNVDCGCDIKTVDVHVRELRRLLEPDPTAQKYFVTVRSVGFKFVGSTVNDRDSAAQTSVNTVS